MSEAVGGDGLEHALLAGRGAWESYRRGRMIVHTSRGFTFWPVNEMVFVLFGSGASLLAFLTTLFVLTSLSGISGLWYLFV